MPDDQFIPDDDQLGPMDYVAVEFPGGRVTGDGFGILLDLVDRGFGRILDLEVVTRTPAGGIEIVDVAALDTEPGVDLTPFTGVSSGILDRADLNEVGGNISPGSVAAALIHEELVILSGVRRLAAQWSPDHHRRAHHSRRDHARPGRHRTHVIEYPKPTQ